MKKFIVAISIAFFLFPVKILAQELQLSGKWQMTYDPDGPVVEDWMVFDNRGMVKLGDGQGVYLACVYDGDSGSVLLVCDVRGKQKELAFKVRDDFRELVNPSGAIYSKIQ
jgi:hypothetical protein